MKCQPEHQAEEASPEPATNRQTLSPEARWCRPSEGVVSTRGNRPITTTVHDATWFFCQESSVKRKLRRTAPFRYRLGRHESNTTRVRMPFRAEDFKCAGMLVGSPVSRTEERKLVKSKSPEKQKKLPSARTPPRRHSQDMSGRGWLSGVFS